MTTQDPPGPPSPGAAPPLDARGWLYFNFKIGLFTFGTGSVMPLYRRHLVEEKRALTSEQFQEAVTLSQMLPGPYLVSLTTYLGERLFGRLVSVLAVLAMCIPGALWALAAMYLIPFNRPEIQAGLAGSSVGTAVLLLVVVAQMRAGLHTNHVPNVPLARGKLLRRAAVAVVVAGMSVARLPLSVVTLAGLVAGLIAEFAP